MAAKKPVDSGEPKLNREERRRQKFGGGRANAETVWPEQRPNPVFVDHTAEPAGAPTPAADKPTKTADKPAEAAEPDAAPAAPAAPAAAAKPAAKPRARRASADKAEG